MYIFRQAERLGLYGWVVNCSDGSVELHAQGSDVDLDYFMKLIERGNNVSQIDKIDTDSIEPVSTYKCFEVKL
jgi:acylphosphatase